MSILRYLAENLDPRLLTSNRLARRIPPLSQKPTLHMQQTEFANWSVRVDRRREDRRKQSHTLVYLDTRCNTDRRGNRGRRWVDHRGQGADTAVKTGIDIYV